MVLGLREGSFGGASSGSRGPTQARGSSGECGWKPLEGVSWCFGSSVQAAQCGGERVKGAAVPGTLGWSLA